MRFTILALTALALSGCEAQTPTPKDAASGEIEGQPPIPEAAALAPDADTPPTPPSPPAPAANMLQPIVRADWRARIDQGGNCILSQDGRDYAVVGAGDGVAKMDGRVIDLAGAPEDFNALIRGGQFTGGGATIEVVLAPDLGEGSTVEETFTKPVRVNVTSAGRTERFEAAWTCGG